MFEKCCHICCQKEEHRCLPYNRSFCSLLERDILEFEISQPSPCFSKDARVIPDHTESESDSDSENIWYPFYIREEWDSRIEIESNSHSFLEYSSDDETHNTHGNKSISCHDSIELERTLFVEVMYSHKETNDEPEVISYQEALCHSIVFEMLTKSSDICRNNKRDRDIPEHSIERSRAFAVFWLELHELHPCCSKNLWMKPYNAQNDRGYQRCYIGSPWYIRDDVEYPREEIHRRGLYSIVYSAWVLWKPNTLANIISSL